MTYATGLRLLDRQLDFTTALFVESGPLSAANGGAHVDPHLLVLATLVAFWAVYIGLRIRDLLATALGVGAERSRRDVSEKP